MYDFYMFFYGNDLIVVKTNDIKDMYKAVPYK